MLLFRAITIAFRAGVTFGRRASHRPGPLGLRAGPGAWGLHHRWPGPGAWAWPPGRASGTAAGMGGHRHRLVAIGRASAARCRAVPHHHRAIGLPLQRRPTARRHRARACNGGQRHGPPFSLWGVTGRRPPGRSTPGSPICCQAWAGRGVFNLLAPPPISMRQARSLHRPGGQQRAGHGRSRASGVQAIPPFQAFH